jgi:hypothetical protein
VLWQLQNLAAQRRAPVYGANPNPWPTPAPDVSIPGQALPNPDPGMVGSRSSYPINQDVEQQYGYPPSERGPRGEMASPMLRSQATADPVKFAVQSLQTGMEDVRIQQFLFSLGYNPNTIAQIMDAARKQYVPRSGSI